MRANSLKNISSGEKAKRSLGATKDFLNNSKPSRIGFERILIIGPK